MKYIIVVRGFNEPDNNTPSEVIRVGYGVYNCSKKRLAEKIEKEWSEIHPCGVSVQVFTQEELNLRYEKAFDIW